MELSTADPRERLREVRLRVTRPRLNVMGVLAHHPHIPADRVHALIEGVDAPSVSRQAVYDVLHALTDAGLVRSMLVGGRALYELDSQDNHHHLLCHSCGALTDVPCAVGHAPCLTPSVDHGFSLKRADVLYSGLCPDCREAEDRSA